MKMNQEQFVQHIKNHVMDIIKSDDLSEQFKTVAENIISEMQNKIARPMSAESVNHLVYTLPFAKVDGNYLTTNKGSIIDLKNKNAPWVSISPEMQAWVKDFAHYLKTDKETKLLSESVDTGGGYTVPEEFRAVMLQYDMTETLVWPRATVWPMMAEKLTMPKLLQNPDVEDVYFDHYSGVTFEWVEEGGTKPETQPEFGLLELIVHELAGYTEITNTLLDDSFINLINYLTRLFRAAWYWYTDKSFLDGTGGKQPLGIYNDPSVLSVNRTTAGSVTFADFLRMDSRLPAMYDNGSVWFISKRVREQIRGEKDNNGALLLRENYNNVSDPYPISILGKPAYLADGKIANLGNRGDVILGNWMWYYIGFRQDFTMDSSRHYKFRNNRTALRCSGRVDGQCASGKAFVILDDVS